ncbi:hypothetical protein [Viscerimonas tarda]
MEKVKEQKVRAKKVKEKYQNQNDLPPGRLTDFIKKFPDGIIRVLDESVFV